MVDLKSPLIIIIKKEEKKMRPFHSAFNMKYVDKLLDNNTIIYNFHYFIGNTSKFSKVFLVTIGPGVADLYVSVT